MIFFWFLIVACAIAASSLMFPPRVKSALRGNNLRQAGWSWGVGSRWRVATAENCANADEQCAEDWTNRTGQGVHRNGARDEESNGRAEHRGPILGSHDPMPPESNPRDEHRCQESTDNSTRPETHFAERMIDHRSECAAKPTENASNKEQSSAIHFNPPPDDTLDVSRSIGESQSFRNSTSDPSDCRAIWP